MFLAATALLPTALAWVSIDKPTTNADGSTTTITYRGRDDANDADPDQFDLYLDIADDANRVFSILTTVLEAKAGAGEAEVRFPDLPSGDNYVLMAVIPG